MSKNDKVNGCAQNTVRSHTHAHTHTNTCTKSNKDQGYALSLLMALSAQCPCTGYVCGKYKILHVFDLCWLSTHTQHQQHHTATCQLVCVCVCGSHIHAEIYNAHTCTYFSTFSSKCPGNVLESKQIIAYISVVVLTSQMQLFMFCKFLLFPLKCTREGAYILLYSS